MGESRRTPDGPRPEYTIEGGRIDADRLGRQAEVMGRATAAFLARAGLTAGWACLDVGCGGGQVTIQMARAAGPKGRAVDEKLFLVELIDNMRDAMLGTQAATPSELADVRAGVDRAARDELMVFHQARMHQVWGRRAD